MIGSTRDLLPLADFRPDAPGLVDRLRESGEPVVLTVDGEPALVIQDAESYRKLLAEVEAARVVDGIRRGLEDAAAGRTMSLDDLKARVRDRHGIES